MDVQKEREAFEEWVNSEFNDHNWYLESKGHYNLHQYREELDDYWQYEETLLWSAWQANKAQAIPEGFVVVEKKLIKTLHEELLDHEPDSFVVNRDICELWEQAEAQEPAKAQAIPNGFTVVPIEITPKQIEAYMKGKVFPASMGEHRKFVERLSKDYKAMIEAAQE